ncbi:hypothetical protein MY4824_001253 [Beauveria thailandica]
MCPKPLVDDPAVIAPLVESSFTPPLGAQANLTQLIK